LQLPSPDKRIHAMKALAALSKYLGYHDTWLAIRQKHSLKWSTGNESLDTFEHFFDDGKTFDTMLQWVRQARQELPTSYSDIFLFCTLTGLRSSEALAYIRLVKDPKQLKTYHNTSRQALEHFRFSKIFIRRTKAAYISLVNDEFLEIAKNAATAVETRKYDAIRMRLESQNIHMHMRYCRKIFASYLRQSGIESEIVDLLQGRVPRTVFARHYFTLSLDYRQKVLRALHKLRKDIER
jgi:intergrase/recombinase